MSANNIFKNKHDTEVFMDGFVLGCNNGNNYSDLFERIINLPVYASYTVGDTWKIDIYYPFSVDNIELVSPTSEGYRQLFALLHKYGYNTVLPLEEVYNLHKRENFNYIQTEYCDVNGVPLDIANDIEEMFNSGVHLWSGKVEKWDVPNWQENLRQWYDTSSNNAEVQNV